jgi:hypothetical protein
LTINKGRRENIAVLCTSLVIVHQNVFLITYILVYIHIYIYIYMCVCVCVCVMHAV